MWSIVMSAQQRRVPLRPASRWHWIAIFEATCLFAVLVTFRTANAIDTPGEMHTSYVNNAVLTVSATGIKNGRYVTGTGINISGGVNVSFDSQSPDTSWNRIEIHEVSLDLGAAGSGILFPLEGETAPITVVQGSMQNPPPFERAARFDSTAFAGSTLGTDFAIRVKAKITLRCMGSFFISGAWTYSDLRPPRQENVELVVNAKAVNALLINSTDREIPGILAGMAPYSLPPEYMWSALSPLMADKGKTGITNHAAIAGERHTKAELLSADKFPMATAWFNSSHGVSSGILADKAGVDTGTDHLSWIGVSGVIGTSNVSTNRLLQLNAALLYSCDCGLSGTLREALFGADYTNQVAFAFAGPVFTALKSGDTTPELPLHDAAGNLYLTDKLFSHVEVLVAELMQGKKASDARNRANTEHPPRTFAREEGGVNIMKVLVMTFRGDATAKLSKVYVGSMISND